MTIPEIRMMNHVPPGEVKGYLMGWICPVFVTGPDTEDYAYRPRLWGHLTIRFAIWYCNVFRKECPVVVSGHGVM